MEGVETQAVTNGGIGYGVKLEFDDDALTSSTNGDAFICGSIYQQQQQGSNDQLSSISTTAVANTNATHQQSVHLVPDSPCRLSPISSPANAQSYASPLLDADLVADKSLVADQHYQQHGDILTGEDYDAQLPFSHGAPIWEDSVTDLFELIA